MHNAPRHAWQLLHPPIQCHAHGWLDVGDGHQIYWETSGHPGGAPALFVHGGPGAGCTPNDRRWFDPQRWRVVLFDQRGAGRSRPSGELQHNSTEYLLRDMETLRRHLGIERWLLLGGSWGATLALAYAQRHPQRVAGLVLRGVFTGTLREWRWLYGADGAARRQPAAWRQFTAALPWPLHEPVPAAYTRELQHADGRRRDAATRAWLDWEQDLMDADGDARPATARTPAPAGRERQALSGAERAHARIGAHYAQHDFFVDGPALIEGAASLQHTAGHIVHGALDSVTPQASARALHAAWPAAHLYIVAGAGHASSHPALAQALLSAIQQCHPGLEAPIIGRQVPSPA